MATIDHSREEDTLITMDLLDANIKPGPLAIGGTGLHVNTDRARPMGPMITSEQPDRTGHLYTLGATGDRKTRSGDQIKQWLSPRSEEMVARLDQWDGTRPFEFDLPRKSIASDFDDLLNGDQLPARLPENVKLVLYPSSKLTDLVKGSFLDNYGFIVSDRAKDILQEFNIGQYEFYQVELIQGKVSYTNYYFFKCLTNSLRYVDLPSSTFRVSKSFIRDDSSDPLHIGSFDDVQKFKDQHANRQLFILADELKLNSEFPHFDLFTIGTFGIHRPVVTERLAHRLRSLTGIELTAMDKMRI